MRKSAKAIASSIVVVATWASAAYAGVDVPAEVATAATTVLVWVVPNGSA